ncbi:MAG TPA: PAS domain S-box protein, partial [Spirochaetia bacterium]|nr:PAS domain S-box protein [Spirochaetia bacterium]
MISNGDSAAAFESSPSPLLLLTKEDATLRASAVNTAFLVFTQCETHEIIGQSVDKLAARFPALLIEEQLQKAFQERVSLTWVGRVDGPSGHRAASVSAAPLATSRDTTPGILVSVSDLTLNAEADQSRSLQAELLGGMSEMAKIGGWEFDAATLEGTWTPEVARIHELDPSDATNARIGLSFYVGESKQKIEAAVSEALLHGTPYDLELELVTQSGARKWVRTIGKPVYERGTITKLRGTFQDITDRKTAERWIRFVSALNLTSGQINQALARATSPEELYQSVCRATVDAGLCVFAAIGQFDPDAGFVALASRVVREGYALPELTTGAIDQIHVTQPIIAAVHANEVMVTPDGAVYSCVVPFKLANNATGILLLAAPDAELAEGESKGILREIGVDISLAVEAIRVSDERRRAYAQLEEELERRKLAMEAAGAGAWERDLESGTNVWSPELWELYGRPPDSVAPSQEEWQKLVHPDDREWVFRAVNESATQGSELTIEYRVLLPGGEERWLLSRGRHLRDPNRQRRKIIGISLDITERKAAERRLRESEERYRTLAEAASDLIVIVDSNDFIRYVNSSAARMVGKDPVEIVGRRRSELFEGAFGRRQLEDLKKVLQTGAGARSEFSLETPSGIRRLDTILAPIFDANRAVTAVLAVTRDITDYRDAEEKLRATESKRHELERELFQAQKLESLAVLASGVAHDFNNILGIIIGHASMLDHNAGDRERILASAQAIRLASARGASVVKQLLTVARKSEPVFKQISVNDIVSETAGLLRATFPKNISVELVLDARLSPVHADPSQLHQVLMNLCVNARDAMPDGGKLTVATRGVTGDDELLPRSLRSSSGFVLITVADTGIGMSEDTVQRIFEPFFTTKGPTKGTGLGLAVAHSIIDTHGGMIRVQSALSIGTTFLIFLPTGPRATEAPETTVPEDRGVTIKGSETVLVIEDEAMLAELTIGFLGLQGYTVLSA